MNKGEIWFADFPEGKGHEQKGERPAIVIGNANGLIVVVPLTSSFSCYEYEYTLLIEPTEENGLTKDSLALVFQIGALDKSRLEHKMGWISKEHKNAIDDLLRKLLKI